MFDFYVRVRPSRVFNRKTEEKSTHHNLRVGKLFTKKNKLKKNNIMMWVIIKHIENKEGVKLPVIILNSDSEIWEFETEERAIHMKNIFETNSDSGYEYVIKKI